MAPLLFRHSFLFAYRLPYKIIAVSAFVFLQKNSTRILTMNLRDGQLDYDYQRHGTRSKC